MLSLYKPPYTEPYVRWCGSRAWETELSYPILTYKNYLIDGRDWTSPTFYRWRNEACSTFNNKSELAIE